MSQLVQFVKAHGTDIIMLVALVLVAGLMLRFAVSAVLVKLRAGGLYRALPAAAQRLGLRYEPGREKTNPGTLTGVLRDCEVNVGFSRNWGNWSVSVDFPRGLRFRLWLDTDSSRKRAPEGLVPLATGNGLVDRTFRERHAEQGIVDRMRVDPRFGTALAGFIKRHRGHFKQLVFGSWHNARCHGLRVSLGNRGLTQVLTVLDDAVALAHEIPQTLDRLGQTSEEELSERMRSST